MSVQFDIETLMAQMATTLRQQLHAAGITEPALIGVRTGGVWVAEKLGQLLGITAPLGELNIAFYRDDFSRIGIHPTVAPSMLPFDVTNRDLVLVDDILYTGRTVRAAMNEIFDYGRPRSVRLVVLFDRGGRELPIAAEVVGAHLNLAPGEHAKLTGPAPMSLEICRQRPVASAA
ncbi:MAG: bifunctional pyr operon transcriptional regulator/uracil phosphoribosyltransferase PyrR [Gammaproteobacteria bacterium]|nr:bifunctional pyr operon transcriptional regulator/uracil phosphoribosyltransferase PyrR [Gammaproteobacteria bacterium]